MKIAECIQVAAGHLENSGIATARVDAEIILQETLGFSRAGIYALYGEEISPEITREYLEKIRLRGKRFPLQYITGAASFYGINLKVSPGVFIPRPETEILVEKAFGLLSEMGRESVNVLDIGTGCGNIAVAIASMRKNAHVTAVDINPLALKVARENIENHRLVNRVRLISSELFSGLRPGVDRFDMIISNPPYIPERVIGTLEPEVRFFEPLEAINGGPDGTSIIRRIAALSPDFLSEDGFLLLEIDPSQTEMLSREIFSGWKVVNFYRDLAGKNRILVASKPG